jgi:hypothetical protein
LIPLVDSATCLITILQGRATQLVPCSGLDGVGGCTSALAADPSLTCDETVTGITVQTSVVTACPVSCTGGSDIISIETAQSCLAAGKEAVTNGDQCNAAAAALSLVDRHGSARVSVGNTAVPRPYGCFVSEGTTGLYLNLESDNLANGGATTNGSAVIAEGVTCGGFPSWKGTQTSAADCEAKILAESADECSHQYFHYADGTKPDGSLGDYNCGCVKVTSVVGVDCEDSAMTSVDGWGVNIYRIGGAAYHQICRQNLTQVRYARARATRR